MHIEFVHPHVTPNRNADNLYYGADAWPINRSYR